MIVLSVSFHFFKWLPAGIGPFADCPFLDRRARKADCSDTSQFPTFAAKPFWLPFRAQWQFYDKICATPKTDVTINCVFKATMGGGRRLARRLVADLSISTCVLIKRYRCEKVARTLRWGVCGGLKESRPSSVDDRDVRS